MPLTPFPAVWPAVFGAGLQGVAGNRFREAGSGPVWGVGGVGGGGGRVGGGGGVGRGGGRGRVPAEHVSPHRS